MQKHILLVDSDAESLDRLSRTLRLHDYRVSEARDGAEGLSLVDSLRPDCIIFDVDLPRVSGTIMYSRLRRSEKTGSCRPLSAATRAASGGFRHRHSRAVQELRRKRCLRLCRRRQPDALPGGTDTPSSACLSPRNSRIYSFRAGMRCKKGHGGIACPPGLTAAGALAAMSQALRGGGRNRHRHPPETV